MAVQLFTTSLKACAISHYENMVRPFTTTNQQFLLCKGARYLITKLNLKYIFLLFESSKRLIYNRIHINCFTIILNHDRLICKKWSYIVNPTQTSLVGQYLNIYFLRLEPIYSQLHLQPPLLFTIKFLSPLYISSHLIFISLTSPFSSSYLHLSVLYI